MAQISKKKTVKDLNVDVVNLAMKVKHLEDTIKGMNNLFDVKDLDQKVKAFNESFEHNDKMKHLEQKVAELRKCNTILDQKIVETALKLEKTKDLNAKKSMEYYCTKCDKKFDKKGTLNDHISDNHPKQIKCKVCSETFDKTHKLEVHLKSHDIERFKCKTCDKIFQLKWRLDKHELAHNVPNLNCCHFYNNFKACPYEENGCKFRHEESEYCRFKELCRNKLCQFQHKNVEPSNTTVTESDEEFEEWCENCGKFFIDISELTKHQEERSCRIECEPCGIEFEEETELKQHIQKHCTMCGEEFSPKRVLEAHKTTCKG